MLKFLILCATIAFVFAGPSYPLVGYGYGVPAATSYSSRIDYRSPVIAKTIVPIVPSYGYAGHYGSLGYPYGSVGYPHGNGLYYGNGLGYGHHEYGY